MSTRDAKGSRRRLPASQDVSQDGDAKPPAGNDDADSLASDEGPAPARQDGWDSGKKRSGRGRSSLDPAPAPKEPEAPRAEHRSAGTGSGARLELAPVLSRSVPASLPAGCECCDATAGCLGQTASVVCTPCGGGLLPLAPPRAGWADPERLQSRAEGACLCVHVHGADRIIPDPYVLHPIARVSVIDEATGRLAVRSYTSPRIGAGRGAEGARASSGGLRWETRATPEASRVAVLPGGSAAALAAGVVRPSVAALDAVPPQSTDPTSVSAAGSAGRVSTGLGLSGFGLDRLASWEQSLLFAGALRPALGEEDSDFREREGEGEEGAGARPGGETRPAAERRSALTMLRPDAGLEALVRPGVLVVVELFDHGPSLPEASTRPAGGLYPVAWGFVRLVAEDDSPRVDVDARPRVAPRQRGAAPRESRGGAEGSGKEGGLRQRGPPGWVDADTRRWEEEGPGGSRSEEEDDDEARAAKEEAALGRRELDRRGRRLQVRMYRWLAPTAAERAAHAATIARAAAEPGAPPGLRLVPSCPAALQYRLRRRQEAPFTLTATLTAALVAPRTTHAEPVIARLLRGPVGSPPSSAPSGPDRATPVHGNDDTAALLAGASERLSRKRLTAADFRGADAPAAEAAKPRKEAAEDAAQALLRRRRPTEPCRVPTSFMRALPSGRSGCLCLRFSEDGAFLAAACADLPERQFPVRVYDPDSGELRAEADGHTDLVYDVRWQPALRQPPRASRPSAGTGEGDDAEASWGGGAGGSSAVSGPGDSTVLGSRGSGASSRRFRGLVTASADGSARVWQFSERRRAVRCVAVLSLTPPSYVYSAAFHPLRPDLVVTGSFDGILRLWQVVPDGDVAAAGPMTPRRPPRPPSHDDGDDDALEPPTPDTPPWAYGGGVFPERCRGVLRGFLGCPPGIAAASTGRRAGASLVMRSSSGGMARLMSPGAASPAHTLAGDASAGGFAPSRPPPGGKTSPHTTHVNAIAFHPSGGRLFSADGSGAIVIWDTSSATNSPLAYKAVAEVRPALTAGLSIVDLQVRPGREHLVVVTHRSGLRIFQILPRALHPVRSLPGLSCAGSRLQLCWSPDGKFILAGSESGRCGIWDADSAREVLATPSRMKRLGAVGFDAIMSATAWHPRQHVIAIGAFGDGAPITLYCREVRQ